MSSIKLTEEQQAVVRHTGGHARVLAVAGSGKTSTMVFRIKHLIEEQHVDPKRIRVLMFNRLARQQFEERLKEQGLDGTRAPFVNTFHSFAFQFVRTAIDEHKLPDFLFWTDENVEQVRIAAHRTIQELEREGAIPPDSVDIDTALETIGLWKGALITPDRAGHHFSAYLPIVYQRFEQKRIEKNAVTFDDFVPLVVKLLNENETERDRWCGKLDHLIVDEYQDVNYGQQKLVELLAGNRADVMVVGDDDQTIYEWRGARPDYILNDFKEAFPNKPNTTYKLSHTFRFGPVLAHCAHNTIGMNKNRHPKSLIAFTAGKITRIHLVESDPEAREDVHYRMAREIVRLVKDDKVPPSEIWVIARMYAQLSSIEAQCLALGVPYHVLGKEPFFKRSEIQKLLDYLIAAFGIDEPISFDLERAFLHIVNTPNRYLKQKVLKDVLTAGRKAKKTLSTCLQVLIDSDQSTLSQRQRQALVELNDALQEAKNRSRWKAGRLLEWINKHVDFEGHFKDYFGAGEDAFERIEAVRNFIGYAKAADMAPAEFIEHVANLDCTLGAEKDELITMSTVFKTKGLEYDYVFIPSCQEGYMPCLYESEASIYDKAGLVKEPQPSPAIENERRLFYVAVTRAKKAVYIAASFPSNAEEKEASQVSIPSRFIEEMQLRSTLPVLEQLPFLPQMKKEQLLDWIEEVKKHGGNKQLIESLKEYLIRMNGAKLAAAISDLTDHLAAAPFEYRYEYGNRRNGEIRDASKDSTKPRSSVWDRIK